MLGPLPAVAGTSAPQLPQVAAIAACDAVICHGGNNTVMEALTAGVPVLAGPFSSDQFVAAEDLRRGGVGDAFAPNDAGEQELADRIARLLDGPARDRAAELGTRLRAHPGAARAWDLIDPMTAGARPAVDRASSGGSPQPRAPTHRGAAVARWTRTSTGRRVG